MVELSLGFIAFESGLSNRTTAAHLLLILEDDTEGAEFLAKISPEIYNFL